jgi:type II secretory pathway component PulM
LTHIGSSSDGRPPRNRERLIAVGVFLALLVMLLLVLRALGLWSGGEMAWPLG